MIKNEKTGKFEKSEKMRWLWDLYGPNNKPGGIRCPANLPGRVFDCGDALKEMKSERAMVLHLVARCAIEPSDKNFKILAKHLVRDVKDLPQSFINECKAYELKHRDRGKPL